IVFSSLFLLSLFPMEQIQIATFNVNGCRSVDKRARLFHFITQKRVNVMFLQETHTDSMNESEWLSEWKGRGVFSHGSNVSAGVAVLFSPGLQIDILSVSEEIQGRLLKIETVFKGTEIVFINLYAPNEGREKVLFFKKLNQVLSNCNPAHMILVGGDCNCTEHFIMDRNHEEPHPQSSKELSAVLKVQSLVDVWRNLYPRVKQYTWVKVNNNNQISKARLDRLYCTKQNLNQIFKSNIIPTMLSDHHCVLLTICLPSAAPSKSYWHFNTKLLEDKQFLDLFKAFWVSWRQQSMKYSSIQQWWDIGKIQIKIFCQQYTLNTTRVLNQTVEELEREILRIETKITLDSDENIFQSLREKRETLSSLLEERVKGSLIRSRFTQLKDMDAPTKFFFNLEKKVVESKQLFCVRLPCGKEVHSKEDINREAVLFYTQLFSAEPCNEEQIALLHQDLPKLSQEEQRPLEACLTMQELTEAVTQMSPGKAPGIDGLQAEFYKKLWPVIGEDLFRVLQECIREGELPLSCRRAVITLLPKKGDLKELKNWRPVSLLCSDYKIFSKALANRLRECIHTVVHKDQSYCIPGRTIFDNIFLIRDFLTASNLFNLDLGIISLDQEKAFDRVDHKYLVKTLQSFGFGPNFISFISLLYKNVFGVLKINNSLSCPFSVYRGIRQGCSLSGMLYALSIEPLLCHLRRKLAGLRIPVTPNAPPVKLSAYADDVNVFITSHADVSALRDSLDIFQKASSAKVNWGKCSTFLSGEWRGAGPPTLPQPLRWGGIGIKVLGVYLGERQYEFKNWEDLAEKVKGRLQCWRWLIPQLSYKGRVVVINNLVASMLWHRLVCLDPPPRLINDIQRVLLEFFWSGHHWLKPAVLYLPPSDGGHGLVDVRSRVATFRLQAVQRLLFLPELSWRNIAFSFLHRVRELGWDWQLFLINLSQLDTNELPDFYKNMLNAWRMVKVERLEDYLTVGALLEEPLFFNSLFPADGFQSGALCSSFAKGGITKLKDLLQVSIGRWTEVESLAKQLGIHSLRVLENLLKKLRDSFSPRVTEMLNQALGGNDEQELTCPSFLVSPAVPENLGEGLYSIERLQQLPAHSSGKKELYRLCVKVCHVNALKTLPDTRWRAHVDCVGSTAPAWRSLYKPPVPKHSGDLQWHILHGIIATGRHVHRIDPAVSNDCVFCGEEETLFHLFTDCRRLDPLFNAIAELLISLNVIFTKELFIFNFPYSHKTRFKSALINFIFGQGKLAIWKTRKNKLQGSGIYNAELMLKLLLKTRIQIDFVYFSLVHDLQSFQQRWCVNEGLCVLGEE
ncbi:YTX2 protein, partial [Polyodon spathula]|nr:YTX2 protein [Polyodon spathula]